MNMRKIIALLLVLVMVCGIIPFAVLAEGETKSITIDFTTTAQRVSQDANSQVWANEGLTLTNEKANSTNNVANYSNPARFYKGSSVKVEYPGMTKIELKCTGLDAKYVNGWSNSFSDSNATATESGKIVTITFAEPVDSFTWTELTAQSRAYTITVYAKESAPEEPAEPTVATIDFSTADQRTDMSGAKQVWANEGLTMTNEKAASTNDVKDYINPVRIYANTSLKIEFAGMTKLVFDCNSKKPVAGLTNSLSDITGITVSTDGYIVTIEFAEAVNELFIAVVAAQFQLNSITAYAGNATTPEEPKPEVPEQPEQPEVPETPETPAYTVVTAPVAGTAYKFGMIQEKVSATDVYYLKGGMSGYYMATTKTVDEAIDVYLEETTGGYYMYTMVGETKTYINMVVSADGAHVNGAYEAAASTVYTFDAEKQTVIAVVEGVEYWFGTRNDKTYTTVGPCAVSYNGFYCKFYAAPAVEPEKPETSTEGTIVFDDTSKRTEFTTEIQIWTENGVTVTNEKAASRSNVADYCKPARFYAASSLKVEFTGMKTLLFKCNTAGHAEALLNSIVADGVKVTIAGSEVLIELAEASDVFFIETLAAQVRVDSITVSTGTQEAPVEPEKPETNDPTPDTELSIKDAIALGASKEHNTYTEGKYYVTGVITEVYNDTYGNMYITDAEGNVLTIYGTYSADGTLRYDAMDVKPVAGDTVKIYGIIGQYNGNPQIKNGWIVEHTPAEQPEQPEQPEPPKTGDFAILAMAALTILSGTAIVLLKKKEF